jgi:hypothetical protein
MKFSCPTILFEKAYADFVKLAVQSNSPASRAVSSVSTPIRVVANQPDKAPDNAGVALRERPPL